MLCDIFWKVVKHCEKSYFNYIYLELFTENNQENNKQKITKSVTSNIIFMRLFSNPFFNFFQTLTLYSYYFVKFPFFIIFIQVCKHFT